MRTILAVVLLLAGCELPKEDRIESTLCGPCRGPGIVRAGCEPHVCPDGRLGVLTVADVYPRYANACWSRVMRAASTQQTRDLIYPVGAKLYRVDRVVEEEVEIEVTQNARERQCFIDIEPTVMLKDNAMYELRVCWLPFDDGVRLDRLPGDDSGALMEVHMKDGAIR